MAGGLRAASLRRADPGAGDRARQHRWVRLARGRPAGPGRHRRHPPTRAGPHAAPSAPSARASGPHAATGANPPTGTPGAPSAARADAPARADTDPPPEPEPPGPICAEDHLEARLLFWVRTLGQGGPRGREHAPRMLG